METSLSRILIADGFEPWRRYVHSALEKCHCTQIVGEASNGWEAVQKAIELKPHLVLLAVALPKLNGIQAAQQIRKAVPGVKLLFATHMVDEDLRAAALSLGADAFIWKVDAQRELLPAIEALCRGEKFIGGGMKG
jgi:DNA-binding NarL/FixJ family response regulator